MEYKLSLEELDKLDGRLSSINKRIKKLIEDECNLGYYIRILDYNNAIGNMDVTIVQRLRYRISFNEYYKEFPMPSPVSEREMDIKEHLIEILKSIAKEELSKISEELRKIKQEGITITI
ncbi:MAG: hypothetical protein LBL13_04690 [Bacteroidales bacterium]|jgi:hypothetical protein|nr:hypothetical protein [Bacteroidales bacterium]